MREGFEPREQDDGAISLHLRLRYWLILMGEVDFALDGVSCSNLWILWGDGSGAREMGAWTYCVEGDGILAREIVAASLPLRAGRFLAESCEDMGVAASF